MSHDLRDPDFVAVWPGMGSVALGAGSYLVEKLAAQPIFELDARDHFDIDKVEVKNTRSIATIDRRINSYPNFSITIKGNYYGGWIFKMH